jgi:transcriptional regulator with XRE-family HTH domain
VPDQPESGPGARIRRLRTEQRWTQRELAGGTYSVSYISAIERGRIDPSFRFLRWCADRLRVPVTDLLGDRDAPSHEPAVPPSAARDSYELVYAETLLSGGQVAEALTRLRELRRRLGAHAPSELVWVYASAAAQAGALEEAFREAAAYRALAEERNDHRLRAAAHWLYGQLYMAAGDRAQAIVELGKALEAPATHMLDLDAAIGVRALLTQTLLALGDVGATRRAAEDTIKAYQAYSQLPNRVGQARELAEAAMRSGDFATAHTLMRWAWFGQREANARRHAAEAYLRQALLNEDPDQWRQRADALRQAMLVAEQAGQSEIRQLATAYLVAVLAEHGERDEAERLLAQHLSPSPEAPEYGAPVRIAALVAVAWVALLQGDAARAHNLAAQAEALLAEQNSDLPLDRAQDYAQLSHLYDALRDNDGAIRTLRRVLQLYQRRAATP